MGNAIVAMDREQCQYPFLCCNHSRLDLLDSADVTAPGCRRKITFFHRMS